MEETERGEVKCNIDAVILKEKCNYGIGICLIGT